MKKILFFAIALVVGVLAFTACDNNGGNPLVGTWSRDTEKDASGWYETQTIIIDGNNGFVFQGEQHDPQQPDMKNIMLMEGKYEISQDIITVHYLKHGWNHNGQVEYISNWEGYDERIQYSIQGNKLTIVRHYGEEYTSDPEVFTKK